MAVGTSSRCEISMETFRQRWKSSINARESASSVFKSIATASARILRNWTVANTTLTSPRTANPAQARNKYHAQAVETVTRACSPALFAPSPELESSLSNGSSAVASKVENHTAKLVREFFPGNSRNKNHTADASSVPAIALYNKPSETVAANP